MEGFLIAVCVIATIATIALRIWLKTKKADKKRRENDLEIYSKTHVDHPISETKSSTPIRRSAPVKINTPAKPIPDPFEDVAVPEEGSLSPAQYNEWLLDFAAAEKAGVRRPIKTGKSSPFARRFNRTKERTYLYKLSGFTPQNSLERMPVEEKVKPLNPSCLFKNEIHGSFPLDAKFTLPAEKIRLKPVAFDICPKDRNACDTFVSFYKDKN